MSFIPLFWRRRAVFTTPEIAARVGRLGSKGAPFLETAGGVTQVVQLLDLDDPAYATNPVWVSAARDVTSAAAQFPSVGLVAGAPRTIVDGAIVSVGATQEVMARYSAQSAGFLGFQVSRDSIQQQPTRSLASTVNNSIVALPATLDRVFRLLLLANTPFWVPLQVRLAAGQMLEVIGSLAQSQLLVTFYCREFQE